MRGIKMKSPAVPQSAAILHSNGKTVDSSWLMFFQELVRKALSSGDLNPIVLDNGTGASGAKVRLADWKKNGELYISVNLAYDAAADAWNRDDINKFGLVIYLDLAGPSVKIEYADTGANPAVLNGSCTLEGRGGISIDYADALGNPGVFSTGGLQVVGKRGARLTDAIAAPVGTAGSSYTTTEQGLINALIASMANQTLRLNQLESRLKDGTGHGLIEA